jgi:hypothetical protein
MPQSPLLSAKITTKSQDRRPLRGVKTALMPHLALAWLSQGRDCPSIPGRRLENPQGSRESTVLSVTGLEWTGSFWSRQGLP